MYSRPEQVLRRLALLGKRHIVVRLAPHVTAMRVETAVRAPVLAATLPTPLFSPRHQLVDWSSGTPSLRVLGWSWPIAAPVEWHPRHFSGSATLEEFNLQYMEYLEALDDDSFVAVVLDWIENNPPYAPRYWLGGWSSFPLSIRCVVWLQQLAARRGRLPVGAVNRMCASLVHQTRFLERNLELDIGGNHLIKNIKALLWMGCSFAGDEPKRWRTLGERLLASQIAEQILPDGMHFERSPAYHLQVFADLLECWQTLGPSPVRDVLEDTLHRMAQVVVDLTHPDGLPSLFADGGLHMAYAPQECIAAFNHLFRATPSPRRVFALRDAGYYGVRVADNYVLLDCGPIGPDSLPGHGHGDVFAFEWSVRGQRIVMDTGVLQYRASREREYVRSTRAHNTVTLDDADQAEFYGEFRVGRRPRVRVDRGEIFETGFRVIASHDGYSHFPGRPIHWRKMSATDSRLEIEDEIIGGAAQIAIARLLLHPDCRITLQRTGTVITRADTRILLRTDSPVTVSPAIWHPDFGETLETKQLVITYGAAPVRGGFTLEAVS
jgi:uncharacterized heparinase superfamily protein